MHSLKLSKTFTGILAFLLLLTFFIPAFKSIPKIPEEGFYLYLIPFAFLIEYPRTFFRDRLILSNVLFILVYLLYSAIGHYDLLDARVTETHFDFYASYATPSILLVFLYHFTSYNSKVRLRRYVFLAVILTNVTSIFAFTNNPFAARMMVGGNTAQEQFSALVQNIGSYNFQYAITLFFPVFFFIYKKEGGIKYLGLMVLSFISVVMAQIMAIIVLLLIIITITLLFSYFNLSIRNYFKFMLVVGFVFTVGRGVIVNSMDFIISSGGTGLIMVDEKMTEIKNVLAGVEVTAENAKNFNGYKVRQELSESGFKESPIFGGKQSGGHHYWIDGLAEHGLVGMFPIFLVLVTHFKWVYLKLNRLGKVIILHSALAFIFIGLFKNITFSLPLIYIFLIPTLLFSHQIFLKSNLGDNREF